jgi:hypothetical protein
MGKGTGVSRPGTIEMVMLPAISTAGVESDDDVARLIDVVREAIAGELQRCLWLQKSISNKEHWEALEARSES